MLKPVTYNTVLVNLVFFYDFVQQYRKFGFDDAAYERNDLLNWVLGTFWWTLQTVLRPVGVKGFVVLPKRWIVERTFAWLRRCQRHSKDYEKTTESSESFTHIAMISLMLKRLEKANA